MQVLNNYEKLIPNNILKSKNCNLSKKRTFGKNIINQIHNPKIKIKKISQNKTKKNEKKFTKDIVSYLENLKNNQSNFYENFKINQTEIKLRMRKILIDWIIQVNFKFKMNFDTLFLSISLIDSYIKKNKILKKDFQLLGITCLFIASKIEEIYPPEIDNFVFVGDNSFSKSDIIMMESKILKSLNFNLNINYKYELITNYQEFYKLTKKEFYLSLMISLINIISSEFLEFSHKIYSLSIILIVSKIMKNEELYNKIKLENSKEFEKIQYLAMSFFFNLKDFNFNENSIITKIFLKEKYFEVAKIIIKNNN